MSRTSNLRQQHTNLLVLATELQNSLDRPMDEQNTTLIPNILEKLTAALKIHFVQEDQTLYPRMIYSDNKLASDTATEFQAQMGDLSRAYIKFADYWSNPSRLESNPEQFNKETKRLLNRLQTRIQRENAVLFPLADAL